jgi:hypothetical protein
MDYSLMITVLQAAFPTPSPDGLAYQIRVFSVVLVFMIVVGLLNLFDSNSIPVIREAALALTAIEIILLVLAYIKKNDPGVGLDAVCSLICSFHCRSFQQRWHPQPIASPICNSVSLGNALPHMARGSGL